MSTYDHVILGSSPNALVAAARLAKAGKRVLLLESAATFGGPVATEEFAPGFRADTGVMSVALDEEVARELAPDMEVLRRDRVTALGASPVTLEAMPAVPEALRQAAALLRAMYRDPAPEVPAPVGGDAAALAQVAAQLHGLGPRQMHEVLRLLFMPVRDFVEELPLGPHVRGLIAGTALRAVGAGPFASGTVYGLLHHLATDDALFRSSAAGGVQALPLALAARARAHGAELRAGVVGTPKILIEDGAARGVRLEGGESIAAGAVISDHDVRATFTRLVSPAELEPEVNRGIRALKYRGTVARVHLALSGLPAFRGVDPAALRGTLVLEPSTVDLERAWDRTKRAQLPERPYVELTVPTVADPGLAPEGKHVLSAWVQGVPHGWTDAAAVAKGVVDRLEQHAPGLRELVLHTSVSLPRDLETRFGLTEGHLYGGEIRLDQTFFLRGLPGFARHRTPVENLYLCGSAAHPGGYSGRSGWNLAAQLITMG